MTGIAQLSHASASTITSFASARRGMWWANKILGVKIPPSPPMIRGNAVESGVRWALLGEDIDTAIKRALEQYDADCARDKLMDLDGKVGKEREVIAPSIELAVDALAGFGVPEYDQNGRQQKVSIFCRYGEAEDERVEIIGFLDFVFPDCIIDLKSTGRIPTVMSWAHQVQRAIYARATGKPVRFLYVSAKKAEMREDGDIDELLAQIKQVVRAIDAFLKLDRDQQRLLAMPDPDDYSWTGHEELRREIFGV